jgi:hypothetical protein
MGRAVHAFCVRPATARQARVHLLGRSTLWLEQRRRADQDRQTPHTRSRGIQCLLDRSSESTLDLIAAAQIS